MSPRSGPEPNRPCSLALLARLSLVYLMQCFFRQRKVRRVHGVRCSTARRLQSDSGVRSDATGQSAGTGADKADPCSTRWGPSISHI